MKLTVDRMLDMIYARIDAEPASFATTGAKRRLAQLRQSIGAGVCGLQVDIPKPAMSRSGRKTLKNSPRASTGASSRKKNIVKEDDNTKLAAGSAAE